VEGELVFERIVTELKAFEAAGLSRRELCDVTAGMARVRGALDALEVRVAAAVEALDDKGGDVESMLRAEGGMSTREAHRRKQRAEQLQKMPNTARKLADGEITSEHADALVRAAEATSVELVDGDESLLANAARRPADLAGRDIRDWATRRQRPTDREQRYRRQRANRSLALFRGDDQMRVAHCRTDDVTGEMLRSRIEDLARRLHRQDQEDQDNNPQPDTTPRTWEQLRHDALMILTGVDNTRPTPADSHIPGAADKSEADAQPDTQSADRCTCTNRRGGGADLGVADLWRPVGVRNTILAVADMDAISGRDPNARMEVPGVGPIPKTVLDRLACDADIFGIIFNGDGVCLWHGRSTRTVSPQQWRALVARDRGCVLCAAHPAYCEAHHIIEWLDLGETEIENLALLCIRHHHQIHETGLMLIRDGPNQWHTAPKPPKPNHNTRHALAV
jgi:hypothetical protein